MKKLIAKGLFIFIISFLVHTATVAQIYTGIVVGTRINDSTGQATIENAKLQQEILSKVHALAGYTIGSEALSIIATKQVSYLVFKVNSSTRGNRAIAMELSPVGNSYYLQGMGKQFHSCQTSCSFIKDSTTNSIRGCGSGNTISPGCEHEFSVSQ